MERLSPPPYPGEQFLEHGATHMLVTLDQDDDDDHHQRLNDCSPTGEDRAFYDQNANISMGDVDMSGISSEGDIERQALFFHPFEHERMIKEVGGVPRGAFLGRFPDGSGMFTSLPRPELHLDFEDHVRDEHISNIRRSIGATAHRSQFCHDGGEQVGLFKPTSMLASPFQGPTDFRNVKVSNDISWERSLQEIREKGSREERTSKALSDSRDFLNLHKPRESLFSLESRLARVMKRSSEHVENNQLDLHPHLSMERYPPSTQSHFESMDDLNNSGPFSHEHLEKSRASFQRFEWIAEHGVSPNPISREETPGIPLRGQTVRGDPPPITLPIFRKSLHTSVGKPSYYEDVSSHTKALAMESEMTQLSRLNSVADWTLQKQNHQVGIDVSGCKQTWTVNDDDSLEQIPPEPLVPAACSNYDADTAPYMCSMLLEDHGKEDLEDDNEASVYTCIECSIYFKKKEHLMEHMLQHAREPGPNLQEPPLSLLSQFSCNECGWSFGDSTALEQHRRLHQESREKIIEEIQKLNDFSDEGREARLQCPKCVFGTNSSKVFVQHAKIHMKERKDQEVKGVLDTTVEEAQETSELTFQHFKPNEPPLPVTPTEDPPPIMKGASTCIICGFPAPSESILKHHIKYSHSSPSWDSETYGEDTNEPGTSKEIYALPKPRPYPETEIIVKKEPSPPLLLQPPLPPPPQLPHLPSPPPPLPSQSHKDIQVKREPGLDFAAGHQRPDSSNISIRKGIPLSKLQNRKLLPYGSLPRKYGNSSYPSSKSYAPQAALKIKKKILAPFKGHGIDNRRKHGAMLGLRHGWSLGKQSDGVGGGFSFKLKTGLQPTAKRANKPMVPRSALELKRTFRNTLRSSDSNIVSEEQRHQLRMMVPVVVLNCISERRKKMKPGRKPFKKKGFSLSTTSGGRQFSRKRMLTESFPLDLLLEGSLEADELLDPDNVILRSEEKKCPYCPDQFHNGIGLANHVRGHLNRVGVSYNVRHFISAEEVKAIEQKFSFQKKKKKGIGEPTLRYEAPWPLVGRPSTLKGSSNVANFDPSTFSLMRCEFCGAGFDTRAGLSSHARAHLRDFGITNWELTISPINILKELLANSPDRRALQVVDRSEPSSPNHTREAQSYRPKSITPMSEGSIAKSPHSPLTTPWANESSHPNRDIVGSEEEEVVAMDLDTPPSQKKMSPLGQQPPLEQNPSRTGSRMSPDPLGSKQDLQDSKSSGTEPVRDIRCEFCGEYFENRKGLSSHARSHLRQMGVTEWYMNGSPIDTMKDLLKRRSQPRPSSNSPLQGPNPSPKPMPKSVINSVSMGTNSSVEIRVPTIPKKMPMPPGSPMARSPQLSPPTARKMFHSMSPPSMHKKPKPEHMKFHFKREMMPVNMSNEHLAVNRSWDPQDDMSPLNLSSRVEPVRDIRCEFCGEYFENRKGLSSHARSHLRQMGVTEWSVNGSPIDTLRELLQKKAKPFLIKKEPNTASPESPLQRSPTLLHAKPHRDEGLSPNSSGKVLQMMPMSPMGGRPGRPIQQHPGTSTINRDIQLSLVGGKPHGPFFTPLSMKRPLQEERMIQSGELKPKAYIQTELHFKSKPKLTHEKSLLQTSSEACCELCGLYFENRKALASHARAHLRQFGVTEWCVNGSPIETLTEWIKHRPQKAGAYRSYIQGGRPFTKKFRKGAHSSDRESLIKKPSMMLHSPGAPATLKGLENDGPNTESSRSVDNGSSSNIIDSPLLGSASLHMQREEFLSQNINKFERRPARPPEAQNPKDAEACEFQPKVDEVRQTPQKVRPVPSLVPRPPQTSLVKFVGNIYTLKCRFCEVEFQGPLSIQEEWVRHLQRHILEMNFSKAVPLRDEVEMPMTTEVQ
ncbi:protein Wiz isoform X8 [Lissotriton helveticus]